MSQPEPEPEVKSPQEVSEEVMGVPSERKAAPKIPNIFVVGSWDAGRALVVVDEGRAYPMDDKADAFAREHNIPIFPEYPEGVSVEGSDRAADLIALKKKLAEA